MSTRGEHRSDASKPLARRAFFILPCNPPESTDPIKNLILENGGTLAEFPAEQAIILVDDPYAVSLPVTELRLIQTTHNIYHSRVVEALLNDPDALEDEDYVFAPKEELEESSDVLAGSQRVPYASEARMAVNKGRGLDRRRLFQPPVDLLNETERAYVTKPAEEYLNMTYINPTPPEDDPGPHKQYPGMWIRLIAIPPPLPGAPNSRRKAGDKSTVPGKKLHDQFFAPPLALSDCPRAADPVDRNYMTSEDFALLMWYVRTIPYCGSETTLDGRPKCAGEYAAYRWNWARTHGVVLRPLSSITERWRKHILHIFCGSFDIPEGNFRTYLALSNLFIFKNNRILGFNTVAIKNKNSECLTSRDVDPQTDPFNVPTPDDEARYRALNAKISAEHRVEDVHQGQRWL